MADTPVLETRSLRVVYPVTGRLRATVSNLRAVDGVDLAIAAGESLALVGESGCGKSSLARAVVGLVPSEGEIRLNGANLNRRQARTLESRRQLQMVFQDPYDSLNRKMKVEDIIAEPLDVHSMEKGADRTKRVHDLLDQVHLPRTIASRYPRHLSGGQRQRVAIARALAVEPSLLVLDEPLSALDVSVQAQMLNLLKELRATRNVAYLFITHDLSVIQYVCDRVAVMYLGRILELGPANAVIRNPHHPYTRALISAVPSPDPETEHQRKRIILAGDVPSPFNLPPGCRFYPRCPSRLDPRCATEEPQLREVTEGHWAACFYQLESERGSPVSR